MIAKTDASGGPRLLPEVLAFTTSLEQDRALLREDVIGSLAHLLMLARRGIVPREAARALHRELVTLWEDFRSARFVPAGEEDIHMAVEAELTRRLGETAGFLHTARSRNDQVALDLRLHVRERLAEGFEGLAALLDGLADRAVAEEDVLFPAYTHRQRAQPVSVAYWLCAYGAMFCRDVDALRFVQDQVDACPLGVGAVAGTGLPIDRDLTRTLLGFSRLTSNGLDTVGDRDFALDFVYAAARCLGHAGRLATDVVDFSTSEFGFVRLDDALACGSSLMPQKRNPDVFELIRGKQAAAVGSLVQLFTVMKGLPGGYNRDMQEDRAPLLGTGALLVGVLSALTLALPRIAFDRDRCRAALEADATQATDVAEALVRSGTPFRTAYQRVGALVKDSLERGVPLGRLSAELVALLDPQLQAAVREGIGLDAAVRRKESAGGTGPAAVRAQIAALRASSQRARASAQAIPRLSTLFASLAEVIP